ncbi:protein of unknown function [Candidatus Hydrogenisulfobacillus filiaventi]|uniref:Uncharacterized protein n=1 Tax=Candidatus Hydrogenisulfobacillus filiaventi TaxID=2707344 RepID=A0A6F8ZFN4_9FIRM|nr:protein of unknown function [Candidatus Hydrogenisulfobacillus filiaventi]
MGVQRRQEAAGFSRSGWWLLGGLALAGAVAVGVSLRYHARMPAAVRSTIVPNDRPPARVVVAITGTPQAPGFIGFIADLHPRSRTLDVVPLPPQLPVNTPTGLQPLWLAVSQAQTPAEVQADIAAATGVPVRYYFFDDLAGLNAVLSTLYEDDPAWSPSASPMPP